MLFVIHHSILEKVYCELYIDLIYIKIRKAWNLAKELATCHLKEDFARVLCTDTYNT